MLPDINTPLPDLAHESLRQQVVTVKSRAVVAAAATTSLAAILAGASATATLTWDQPMPTTAYRVLLWPCAGLAGAATLTIAAQTTTTCTVTVQATASVGVGAILHAQALTYG